jgi:hypothetical protein
VLNQGLDKHLEGVDLARRGVVARLVSGSEFTQPVVVGFGMGHSTKAAFDLGVGPNTNTTF